MSITIENCSFQMVFDILESNHMLINEIVKIPTINLDIAYTNGIKCKSAFGSTIFEFTIYNVITLLILKII